MNIDGREFPVLVPTCDFCSQEQVNLVMNFQARNVTLGTSPLGLDVRLSTDWLACPDCAELLRARRFKELLDRSARKLMAKWGIPATGLDRVRESIGNGWRDAFGDLMEGL